MTSVLPLNLQESHKNDVYVYGSAGLLQDGLSARISWVASLDVEAGTLAPIAHLEGIDARMIHVGEKVLCAVRRLKLHQGLHHYASVQLYESTDMRSWTATASPSDGWEIGAYDLATFDRPVCFGVRPAEKGESRVGEMLELVDGAWRTRGTVDLDREPRCVELIQGAGASQVEVLVVESHGLVRKRLASHRDVGPR